MAGVGHGVATHQDRLEDHKAQTGNGFGPLVGSLLHIHCHLRGGVEGLEQQLGLEQLHTFNGLDQFVVLERQTLGGLDAEVRAIGLLHMGQLRQLGLVGNGVLLNRTQQQTLAFGGLHRLHVLHRVNGQPLGDVLAGVDHLAITLEALQRLGIGAEVELTTADDDFAQDVVLLGDGDDARGLAEDVFDNLGAGLDPLTVGDHQQGDVLVDFVGLLGDPQQGAALVDLVTVLGGTGLLDRQTRGELHQTTGAGAEAVIRQFSDDLTGTDLAAGDGVEAVTGAVFGLEVPDLTGVGGLLQQLEVLEGHRRGDDLHLTGITDGVAQAHFTAVLTALAGFGQHLPLSDLGLTADHWLSVGRQVVDVAGKHPHPAETLGLQGDVALAVGDLTGLDRLLVAHLASQVADHVLGGLLHTLLDRTSGDLRHGDVGIDVSTVVDEQQGAVGDLDLLGLALAGRLDREVEINLSLLGVHTVGSAVRTHTRLAAELDGARHLGANHTGFSSGHTTGVEGPHGELGSRLTDRLGRDDADGFTQVDQFVVGQRPAVALAANGTVGFTGERRTHTHGLDASGLEGLGQRRIDFGVALSQHLAIGIHHLGGGQATHKPAAEFAVLSVHHDVAGRAAVVLTDDHILGNVHQTTGEITGVGGAQRRIHQTLPGAIGGDDVLGDRQTLTEVGADRKVNDFTLRVGHQAAHAHQLTHLGHVSPGAGVGHHPHRVQRCVLVKVLFDGIHQTLVGLGPGVDHLGVTLHLGDFTQAIALFGGRDLFLGLAQQILLRLGHLEVVDGDRHSRLGGVLEAEILEVVGHGRRHRRAVVLVGPGDELLEGPLVDDLVAERRWGLRERTRCAHGSLFGGLGGFAGFGLAGFRGRGHGCARIRN